MADRRVQSQEVLNKAVLNTLPYKTSFQPIKSWHEHRLSLPRSDVARRQDMLQMLKARVGDSAVDNMFGDRFGSGKVMPGTGRIELPLDTPGLEMSARKTAWNNWRSAKGHRRTLMYAEHIHRGGRFEVRGINQTFAEMVDGRIQKGDYDLQLESRTTGRLFDVEVKDRKVSSMRRDLARLKRQVTKEIKVAQDAGREYAFVSRNAVPPELRELIESRGGHCLENVSSRTLPKEIGLLDAAKRPPRLRTGGGLALLGLGGVGGIFEVYTSTQRISRDLEILNRSRSDSVRTSLQIAENSMRLTTGAISVGETVTGGLLLAGVGSGSKLITTYIPGVGMVVAPTMLAGESGLSTINWQLGYISDAEYGRTMRRLGIQTSGMAAGAAVGAAVGVYAFGVGALPGAVVGGAIGHGLSSLGIAGYDASRRQPRQSDWWVP